VRRFAAPFLTSLALLNYSPRPITRHQNPFRDLEGLFSESDIARHEFINREGHGWGLRNVTRKSDSQGRTYQTFALNIHLAVPNPAHGYAYHTKAPSPYAVSLSMVIYPKLLRSLLPSCWSEITQGWEGKSVLGARACPRFQLCRLVLFPSSTLGYVIKHFLLKRLFFHPCILFIKAAAPREYLWSRLGSRRFSVFIYTFICLTMP